MLTKLEKKVYNLLKKIPRGWVTTYKILARATGKPKNWREITKILSKNPHPSEIKNFRSRINADKISAD